MPDTEEKPVLLITTSTFPRWEGDGEPRFIYDLCTRLTDAFKVIVLAPSATGTNIYEQTEELTIHRFRYAPSSMETLAYNGGITANLKKGRWKLLLLPGFFFFQWLAVRNILKQHPVAAIHAHWLIPQGVVAAFALLKKRKNIALLITSHGSDLLGLQDDFSLKIKRWVIKRSDAITVVSGQMRETISQLGLDKLPTVEVIPMGTDLTNRFTVNKAIQRKTTQLLFVGRLVEKKGLETLISAFSKVKNTNPDITLVIAGSGPLEQRLKDNAAQLGLETSITFVGKQSHSRLANYYQESTITVIPSEQEGFGLTVVEAAGCGCPVIASDLPSIRHIIQHGKTGYLCPPKDLQALNQTIVKALNNPDSLRVMAEEARLSVQERFDWKVISDDYTRKLQTIILET